MQILAMAGVQTDGEMPAKEAVLKTAEWVSEFDSKVAAAKDYYTKLFAINRLETPDAFSNYYINYWVVLQMNWVASLDRG